MLETQLARDLVGEQGGLRHPQPDQVVSQKVGPALDLIRRPRQTLQARTDPEPPLLAQAAASQRGLLKPWGSSDSGAMCHSLFCKGKRKDPTQCPLCTEGSRRPSGGIR